MKRLKSIYLERRLFLCLLALAALCAAGYYARSFLTVGLALLAVLVVLLLTELFLLLRVAALFGHRTVPDRFSNGDENDVLITLASRYPFPVQVVVLDELPAQLQVRDARHELRLAPGEERTIRYAVKPLRRGDYAFGAVNAYVSSPIGLLSRRYRFSEGAVVPVYPSFLQMRAYELMAGTERLSELGVKRIRRLGHTMEFDHIRGYVVGDDPASVNWKATARRSTLMVNQYQEERGQPVYCIIDTGRVMEMPFEGMTLLDYSINASLVLSNIALLKHDRAGLITFSKSISFSLRAERQPVQIQRIQRALYNVDTDFPESDFAALASHVSRQVRGRSLLLIFTNFETRTAMRRQLPYLTALARRHVVVTVFFQNTELNALLHRRADTLETVYDKAVAEKFALEKHEIVAELRRNGILSVLTAPQSLTPGVLNKYLELKSRGTI